MSFTAQKRSAGFIHIAALLAMVALLIGGLAFYSLNKGRSNSQKKVLSASSENKSTTTEFKKAKLLGLFEIQISKKITVSAQTGQIVSESEDTFSKILEKLSF
ncbi:hypothetical protein A3D00_01305 [Candidatus Woesebacteria bacterium RIFCSPHIGHO2_02_FULL_38_9]|uniref:Uncharacterized protein n=1 Tax=Candidatus Woesebacteria bacterium RIFCSPHIGHO2_01_FULL_39_28 TaxID=1802496 RepID=A0A1F7YHF0_9BACT|nr:MAG: hypothetical protein A2627_01090 [Candidatus Woesebacteria bacterium RIFCSPHIGHO2_01_FULL_39_28]OGM31759.1 MAG: hypothetical protein A3D00_01305 [Candidatus Woesebacteria bacterium RIFCSPHIGHO2_02_FULL_38_9]OGM57701.1 MAG: hypothetical protein A3A50_01680 [Candidatus Woesebacteria bacterium RIFCSPLOWO2_01_FULL_38_20]